MRESSLVNSHLREGQIGDYIHFKYTFHGSCIFQSSFIAQEFHICVIIK